MPTINRYQNKPGYYIRAGVSDSIITYQVSPQACQLFKDLGYTHGGSIPLGMIQDLRERGDIYTGSSDVDMGERSDEITGLSPDQEQIYENYLRNNSKNSIRNRAQKSVNALFQTSDSTAHQQGKGELKRDLIEDLIPPEDINILASIRDFSNHPYEIKDVEINGSQICFEFQVSNDIMLVCRDDRWVDDPHDFHCEIKYNCSNGVNASLQIQNGYFEDWSIANGEHSNAERIEDIHATAFKADFGMKSGLGFDQTNWTEVVRKLFLFLNRYDVRPYNRGHKGLCTLDELEGKSIWIDAVNTTSSSTDGSQFVISNEIVDIFPSGISRTGWHFVEIEEIQPGRASARPTRLLARNNSSNQ